MLVLSRRPNEKIVLPGLGITFTVLNVKANRVELGIDAPAEVAVHREEVCEARRKRSFRARPIPSSGKEIATIRSKGN